MIPSRRPGGIHPRPEISHRLQHCDEYARPLNLPLFSHINHYTQRLAEEERRPPRRAAGGRRGRSISMSAHRLNATETDGQQMAPGEHRIAGPLLCRTCSQVADIAFTLFLTFMRTKRAERGNSATAAVAPDRKHKEWNRRRQHY
jgi:hypothetical protein